MSRTSTESKRKYNERVYTKITVQIPNELAERFKAKCEADGTPQRQVLMELITRFLSEK
jgi:predicted DNA binding CopG/RHH family protein